MSRGLNKALLIGNLTADPDVKIIGHGQVITKFSLATNEKWKDKAGELCERTEFHRIVCFGKVAEIAEKYLKKGQKVFIEGKIRLNKWTDKETGHEKQFSEIHCDEINLLDSSKELNKQDYTEDDVNF